MKYGQCNWENEFSVLFYFSSSKFIHHSGSYIQYVPIKHNFIILVKLCCTTIAAGKTSPQYGIPIGHIYHFESMSKDDLSLNYFFGNIVMCLFEYFIHDVILQCAYLNILYMGHIDTTWKEFSALYCLGMGFKTLRVQIFGILSINRKGLYFLTGFMHLIGKVCAHSVQSEQYTLYLSPLKKVRQIVGSNPVSSTCWCCDLR